jgi:hypothetical protein
MPVRPQPCAVLQLLLLLLLLGDLSLCLSTCVP